MVVFTLQLVTPREKRREMVQTLRSMIGPTQAEHGCLGCHLQQDADDPNLLTFNEEWQEQSDLDRHMASEDYRKLLAVMDMAGAPPQVMVLKPFDESGLERIAAARKTKLRPDQH